MAGDGDACKGERFVTVSVLTDSVSPIHMFYSKIPTPLKV